MSNITKKILVGISSLFLLSGTVIFANALSRQELQRQSSNDIREENRLQIRHQLRDDSCENLSLEEREEKRVNHVADKKTKVLEKLEKGLMTESEANSIIDKIELHKCEPSNRQELKLELGLGNHGNHRRQKGLKD